MVGCFGWPSVGRVREDDRARQLTREGRGDHSAFVYVVAEEPASDPAGKANDGHSQHYEPGGPSAEPEAGNRWNLVDGCRHDELSTAHRQ